MSKEILLNILSQNVPDSERLIIGSLTNFGICKPNYYDHGFLHVKFVKVDTKSRIEKF